MPCIATVSLAFVFWNNLLIPMVVLAPENKTLPILITEVCNYGDRIGAQYVAICISVIPILVAFSFFSKYIISGITEGAIKG